MGAQGGRGGGLRLLRKTGEKRPTAPRPPEGPRAEPHPGRERGSEERSQPRGAPQDRRDSHRFVPCFRRSRRSRARTSRSWLQGESGTGKELVAEALHRGSPGAPGRSWPSTARRFPEGLAESELFGHEKGAFTGGGSCASGKVRAGARGTLFLDEVSTLSPRLGEAPEGSREPDLRACRREEDGPCGHPPRCGLERGPRGPGEERGFREDLFYRLNTVLLVLPPLRERTEDIPLLVEFFSGRAARRHGKAPKTFTAEALEALKRRPFPGNVRELEHLVEMLTLMVDEDAVAADYSGGHPFDPGIRPWSRGALRGDGRARRTSSSRPSPGREASRRGRRAPSVSTRTR